MPDKYNFDHLGNEYACIEKDCGLRDFVWNLPDDARKTHYMEHNTAGAIIEGTLAVVMVNRRVRNMQCRKCGEFFEQERRRGRPFLECDTCRK